MLGYLRLQTREAQGIRGVALTVLGYVRLQARG